MDSSIGGNFDGCLFKHRDFTFAVFAGSTFKNAMFIDCKLGADFTGCDFQGCGFKECDLAGAILTDCKNLSLDSAAKLTEDKSVSIYQQVWCSHASKDKWLQNNRFYDRPDNHKAKG